MDKIEKLILEMIAYDQGDPRRIQHFLKVFTLARLIGKGEGLDESTQRTVEVSAVVHDIGIKISEMKYNSSAGKYQELEGPPLAKTMLLKLGFEAALVERVAWLVGHHHSYHNIVDTDHQILVEADFLVNVYEERLPESSQQSVYHKIFKTATGANLFRRLYIPNEAEGGGKTCSLIYR